MQDYADLHIHSKFSDGTFSFSEIISRAAKSSLRCVSVTDHDNIDIYKSPEFLNYHGEVEVIKGVELSVGYQRKEVHLLGYFPDGLDENVFSSFASMKQERLSRALAILGKLRQLGIDLDEEEFRGFVKDSSAGRMHIAVFLRDKGFISSYSEAFSRYIGEGCPAYIPRRRFGFTEGVEFLKKQGALVFLAHPAVSGLDPVLTELASMGIDGIEAFYPGYSREKIDYYLNFARKHNLLASGGSDCHGEFRNNIEIGSVKIPYEYVERFRKK